MSEKMIQYELTDEQEQQCGEAFEAIQSNWNLTNYTQAEVYAAGFLAGLNTAKGTEND